MEHNACSVWCEARIQLEPDAFHYHSDMKEEKSIEIHWNPLQASPHKGPLTGNSPIQIGKIIFDCISFSWSNCCKRQRFWNRIDLRSFSIRVIWGVSCKNVPFKIFVVVTPKEDLVGRALPILLSVWHWLCCIICEGYVLRIYSRCHTQKRIGRANPSFGMTKTKILTDTCLRHTPHLPLPVERPCHIMLSCFLLLCFP